MKRFKVKTAGTPAIVYEAVELEHWLCAKLDDGSMMAFAAGTIFVLDHVLPAVGPGPIRPVLDWFPSGLDFAEAGRFTYTSDATETG